ncbi:protein kinase domain-containing protein [Silvibacterium acidisoli]|uniref:protein kinase domain-containing protein n=1 Tax=Acidobacteriaceae bacterium ZG23-2 TaxID=2883246 RepID=UPI00406CF59C
MSDPKLIGRYVIRGELGRGGMGVVYRGEDRQIGREVAIKTLTEVTPELRDRFYLEARSGILSHPNIVTVYELGEHEESPFIAMELVNGESLERMLRARKRIPLLESLLIVEQLCAGLGYAHGHGVVHRDVKPANVLVRPDGRVTIVDFGIARLADQTSKLTQPDALLGTFHYIAPERLKGEISDGRADVWSVGVMLYEMLSGELPFKGKDVSSLYRVINEPYVPLHEYVQDLPPGLIEVLDRALAKQVQDRYAAAEEMAFDLQAIADDLKGERVSALLQSARNLADEREYVNARSVLLQAQRIDPRNTEAKALAIEVQDRMNELQRSEQLLQLVEQAQSAAEKKHWEEAILLLEQAQGLDTENAYDVGRRITEVLEQKEQQQKLIALWERASDARRRGDLTGAEELLSEALRIDTRSTDLRNAYSVVARELRRKQETAKVEELLRGARESYTMRSYTEAIARLREATEIDPAHPGVQELLFTVTTRQKEDRRQQLLDKLALEIQESLDREDYAQADDRLRRAFETLPEEPVLTRLQEELSRRKREREQSDMAREVVLRSQELLADEPERAMEVINRGLAQLPDSPILLQARDLVLRHQPEKQVVAEKPVNSGAKAAPKPTGPAPAKQLPAVKKKPGGIGSRFKLIAVVAGVFVCVLIAGSVLLSISHRPKPSAPLPPVKPVATTTKSPVTPVAPAPRVDFEIDASPWATVVSIADAKGQMVPLPSADAPTPLRMEGVKTGVYTVNLRSEFNHQEKAVQCSVTEQQHLCTADLGTPDVQTLVNGEHP